MTDPTADYFQSLGEHGRYPLLRATKGTIRFDLGGDGHAEHWRVTIDKGRIEVGRGSEPADCVVHVAKNLFDGMVTGQVNTMAAVLRGQIDVEGELHLIVMLQRLFPGRPSLPAPATRRHRK
ncbi:SCP2 sterol-binding domain-containing protein [Catellatospora vulcania]|uniref:SCP2 sterol-binding domain-containing protein n=1 Tax=Catellatospora vulcania TaxID=1460450 RepID=UPI0018AF8FA7|nr:SCP2 sterol-binding domain-containing protein [Catellatospora vulcania]